MNEKKRLDTSELELDSLEVEELDGVAGGVETGTNVNCGSCTCPPPNSTTLV